MNRHQLQRWEVLPALAPLQAGHDDQCSNGHCSRRKVRKRGFQSYTKCSGISLTDLAAHSIQDPQSFSAELTQMNDIYNTKWCWAWPRHSSRIKTKVKSYTSSRPMNQTLAIITAPS